MFEEIVGTSSALQEVLSRLMKVAPTDSSVLIIGETGRAEHRTGFKIPSPFRLTAVHVKVKDPIRGWPIRIGALKKLGGIQHRYICDIERC